MRQALAALSTIPSAVPTGLPEHRNRDQPGPPARRGLRPVGVNSWNGTSLGPCHCPPPVWSSSRTLISARSRRVATAFHRFLDAVPTSAMRSSSNGDLFDFWFEYGSVIPRTALRHGCEAARPADAWRPHHVRGRHPRPLGGDFSCTTWASRSSGGAELDVRDAAPSWRTAMA